MINRSFVLFLLAVTGFSAPAQQIYKLDLKNSKILWKAPKTMGNRHYGFLLFNYGSLKYSPTGRPVGGSFGLDMNTISSTDHSSATENQKVNAELKGDDFFQVSQYPAGTMVVKQIVPGDRPNVFMVKGDLSIKRVTHAIEFPAMISKTGNVIKVTADLMINRGKWNIKPMPKPWEFLSVIKEKVIADEIPVMLDLVFSM
jgi:polyisoprenoid-binding protein YceI